MHPSWRPEQFLFARPCFLPSGSATVSLCSPRSPANSSYATAQLHLRDTLGMKRHSRLDVPAKTRRLEIIADVLARIPNAWPQLT